MIDELLCGIQSSESRIQGVSIDREGIHDSRHPVLSVQDSKRSQQLKTLPMRRALNLPNARSVVNKHYVTIKLAPSNPLHPLHQFP